MEPLPLHHVWHYTDVDRDFWREHLADWLPRRIFDAHTHVNEPEFRRETPTEEKRRQYWVNEVSEPIGGRGRRALPAIVFPDREFSCLCFGMPELGLRHRGEQRAALGRVCPRAAGTAWPSFARSGRPSAWPRN